MHVTIQNKKIFKNRFENFAFFYTVEGFWATAILYRLINLKLFYMNSYENLGIF